MNCDSWLEPKNSLMTADTGFALMSSWGIGPLGLRKTQTLLDCPLHPHQPMRNWFSTISPTLTYAPVAQVIDIIDGADSVTNVDQHLEHIDDVFLGQDVGPVGFAAPDAAIEFHSTYRREIVAIGLKNRLLNRFSAASLVGGSPGRIMR